MNKKLISILLSLIMTLSMCIGISPMHAASGSVTVEENLFAENFESGYTAGSDATAKLYEHGWHYADAKQNGILQVESIDGSNALMIGKSATNTSIGPLAQAGTFEGLENETVQISVRFKPYNQTNHQFKVTATDTFSHYVDFIYVAGNNLTFCGVETKGVVKLGDWNQIRMILDFENEKATLYFNDDLKPFADNMDISAFLTEKALDTSKFNVRFNAWLWGSDKVGYHVDDISIDRVTASEGGGAVTPPEENPGDDDDETTGNLTVKENLVSENFDSDYTVGADATAKLYDRGWNYVDAKTNGILQVDSVDGSNALLIGKSATNTSIGPLAQAKTFEGLENETMQISVRFKPYNQTNQQFKVTLKDSLDHYADLIYAAGNNLTFCGVETKGVVKLGDWNQIKMIIDFANKKATLYFNDTTTPFADNMDISAFLTEKNFDASKFNVRFNAWLWGSDKVGYYVDDISIDLMEASSGGGTVTPPEENPGDDDDETTGNLTVKENLVSENFDSDYTVGADATAKLYDRGWNYVDAKTNGLLQVDSVDGSNALLIGKSAVNTSIGPLAQAKTFEGLENETMQISVRFKPYNQTNQQFKVTLKDSLDHYADLIYAAGNNLTFCGVETKGVVKLGDWNQIKMIIDFANKKGTLYFNDTTTPFADNMDISAFLTEKNFDASKFNVRFNAWLWGSDKVGYYVDDISIDLMETSSGGGTVTPPEENPGDDDTTPDDNLTVAENIFAENFNSEYELGADATAKLYNRGWVYADAKTNGILQVDSVDGSNALLIGKSATNTSIGPLAQAGTFEGLASETVQISFRFKPYNGTNQQFKVTATDTLSHYADFIYVAGNNLTFFGVESKGVVKLDDWNQIKMILDFETKKGTLYLNNNAAPFVNEMDIAPFLTEKSFDTSKFNVRFNAWLWGSDKVGYYVDDISIDRMGEPGGETAKPAIALTAPSNGQTFIASLPVTLSANVTANGNTIDKVEFYVGQSKIGEDLSVPYSCTWTPTSKGSYAITAKAVSGNSQYESAAVTVTVKDESEMGSGSELIVKRSIFADNFNTGYQLDTDATAALDAKWSFVQRDDSKNERLIVESVDGDSVLFLGLDNTPTGTQQGGSVLEIGDGDGYDATVIDFTDEIVQISFRYKAYNGDPKQLKVVGKDVMNTMKDILFVDGAHLTFFGQKLSNIVSRQDWVKIKMVINNKEAKASLYLNDSSEPLFDEVSTSSLGLDISRFKVRFTAWMWGNNSKAGFYLDDIAVNVMLPEGVPAVSLTSPAEGTVYNSFAPVSLTSTVVNIGDKTVSKMEFYANGIKVGEDTSAPYSCEWTPDAYGAYEITAKAYVDSEIYTSAAVNVSVTERESLKIAITSPKDGSKLNLSQTELTAFITNPNNETVDKVAFFVNGSMIAEGSELNCAWTPEDYRDYIVIAKAYVGDAEYISDAVNVSVKESTQDSNLSKVISEYTFNDREEGTSPGYDNMSGWLVNAPEANTKVYFTKIDDEHLSSMTIEGTAENSNWAGGYAEFEVPASKVGERFTVEAEVYFDEPTKKDINLFELRSTTTRTFCSTLSVNGTLQAVKTVGGTKVYTSLLELKDKQWYSVKLDFNMTDKIYDLTLTEEDGTQHVFTGIELGNRDVPTNEGFYVRVMMNTMGKTGSITLDNIRLTAHYEMPQMTSVAFRNADGTLTEDTKRLATDIEAIEVYFNEAITLESVTKNVKVYQGSKQTELSGTVSWNSALNAAVFTPDEPIMSGTDYVVEVLPGVVSALSGAVSIEGKTVEFTTIGSGIFVSDAEFKADDAVIVSAGQLTSGAKVTYTAQIANQTGEAKTVTVLVGLYRGNQLLQLTAKTVEVSASGVTVTAPELTVPDSTKDIICVAWLNDGLLTRKPLGAGDSLR